MISPFALVRDTDVSGVSGCGLVAEGVMFEDGSCVLRWRGPHKSTAVWASMESMLAVHGHAGATRLVFEACERAACAISTRHSHGMSMVWLDGHAPLPSDS